MRLHRLVVEGIGPYAERQELDFDELTAQGLFLLTGPTGAGKTTVLDAIVFALYGTVPGARSADGKGDRRVRERIVSDLRDINTKPEVELEFTAGGRRLLVRRSPDHLRPKARGQGTTMAGADASLEEFVDGMWVPRSTDFREISVELQDLLGMNAAQFTQVVLLPQGEFAGFLRASIDGRRAVLEKLFRVDRYESAERWFRDHAASARATLDEAQDRVDAVIERLVGALGPAASAEAPRGGTAGEVAGWVAAHRTAVDAAVAVARSGVDATDRDATLASEAHARAVRLAELEAAVAERDATLQTHAGRLPRARQWVADRVGAELAADEAGWAPAGQAAREQAAALHTRVADEQRVPAIVAEAVQAEDAAKAAATGAAEADAARAEALRALGPVRERATDAPRAEEAQRALRGERAAVAARIEAALRRDAIGAEIAAVDAAVVEAKARWDEAAAALASGVTDEELDHRRSELGAAQTALAERRAQLESDLAQLAREATGIADDRVARERLELEHGQLVVAQSAARDAHHVARTAYLQAREARLDAMAAELAADLVEGEACPVCGSTDHPAPTQPGGPHDLRALEATANDRAQETERHLASAERALADCAGRLATIEPEQLDARQAALETRGAECRAALEQLTEEGAALAQTAATLQTALTSRRAAVDGERAAHQAFAAADQRAGALREQLAAAEALAGGVVAREAQGDLAALDAELGRLAEQLSAAAAAREHAAALETEAERCATRSAELRSRAAEQRQRALGRREEAERLGTELAALRGDHPTVEAAARAASEHARNLEAAAELLAAHQIALAERDTAAATLAAAVTADPPGPGEPAGLAERIALRADACRHATEAASLAVATLSEASRQQRAVTEAETELASALAQLGPAAEAADRLIRMDQTIRGQGDNVRRISLATYVLAARLEQVAAAATGHLLRMSSGRYELVHHDDRDGGRGQAGLGLRVRDGWTGEERDTATLSGGEAFYASLALALGLAEVVTNEAGGRPLDTLLVDEGFGSLDPGTLEEVLSELDHLRAGGRAIGLVSHVQALAERIPAQLQVTPGRGGSTATVVTAG